MTPLVTVDGVGKTFTLHLRGGTRLDVLAGARFEVRPGECVALGGPSGTGKSSLLRMIAGNYRCDTGRILVRDGDEQVDIATAAPRRVIALRRHVIGWVSQFLRVIPRIGALDLVIEAGRETGLAPGAARTGAQTLLARLNLPERLWPLPPATFSGGEQQRVNLARGLAGNRPLLLLDEPTAALDAANRNDVATLIRERLEDGAAVIGIFHDSAARDTLGARVVDVSAFRA